MHMKYPETRYVIEQKNLHKNKAAIIALPKL